MSTEASVFHAHEVVRCPYCGGGQFGVEPGAKVLVWRMEDPDPAEPHLTRRCVNKRPDPKLGRGHILCGHYFKVRVDSISAAA